MKCPKCGYIGFETTDRCRNCGYEFALASAEPEPSPLEVKKAADDDGPLADLVLTSTPLPSERRRTPPRELDLDRIIGAPEPAADLPLFDVPSAAERPARETPPSDPPPRWSPPRPHLSTPAPTPRRPLSVRRSTPDPARFRSAEPEPRPSRNLELPLPGDRVVPADVSEEADRAAAGQRLLAALTDTGILLGIDLLVLYFTLRLCALGFGDVTLLPIVPLAAFFILLNGGYLLAFTAATGQTIGKMAFGLKVVSVEGQMSAFTACLRSAGCLLSAATLGAGLAPALFGGRALHDRLAGTTVVVARE